jgi:hypothetical protein
MKNRSKKPKFNLSEEFGQVKPGGTLKFGEAQLSKNSGSIGTIH